jgi:hypothetical protein
MVELLLTFLAAFLGGTLAIALVLRRKYRSTK